MVRAGKSSARGTTRASHLAEDRRGMVEGGAAKVAQALDVSVGTVFNIKRRCRRGGTGEGEATAGPVVQARRYRKLDERRRGPSDCPGNARPAPDGPRPLARTAPAGGSDGGVGGGGVSCPTRRCGLHLEKNSLKPSAEERVVHPQDKCGDWRWPTCEDVLDLYAEPYDPQRTQWSVSTTSSTNSVAGPGRQRIRTASQAHEEAEDVEDYEYRRERHPQPVPVLRALGPPGRHVSVTQRRTTEDFAPSDALAKVRPGLSRRRRWFEWFWTT